MSRRTPWASWDAFVDAVTPRHVKRARYDSILGYPELVVRERIAYHSGAVNSLAFSARALVGGWTYADAGFITVPATVVEFRRPLVQLVNALSQAVEELVLAAGDSSRFRRLLQPVRAMSDSIPRRDHASVEAAAMTASTLAGECASDLAESTMGAAQALDTELGVQRLPPAVRRHFVQARDVLLLGESDLAAFAACRGLERACRDLAGTFALSLSVGQNAPRPLGECDLNDILEMLARCHWADGTPVLDRPSSALVNFVRQMRNVTGHASATNIEEWREVAALAAGATCRLVERAGAPNQSVTPTTLRRSW